MYSSACQTSLLSTNAVSEVHLASLGNLRDGGSWPARVMSQFLIEIIKKQGMVLILRAGAHLKPIETCSEE